MSTKFSFGKLQFDLAPSHASRPIEPESPFCIAVLGNFSGHSNTRGSLGERTLRAIDIDNFEKVMGQFGASLRLTLGQAPEVALGFSSLDDFHPDKLVTQLPQLRRLSDQRQEVLGGSAGAGPAAGRSTPSASAGNTSEVPVGEAAKESETDLLARLMGGAPVKPAPTAPHAGMGAVERLIQSAVSDSVVLESSAREKAVLSATEMDLCAELRALLHHQEFQELEATWRGTDLLVRNFGGEENVRIYLVDITEAELQADLNEHPNLDTSAVWKTLSRQNVKQPWAAWLGLFTYGESIADLETLGAIAKISAQLGSPFFAAASPKLVGCDSFHLHPDADTWTQPISDEFTEAWEALRGLPEAEFLALALPRFLLRQPYGKDSDPIDSFPFEELIEGAPHEAYLWGNGGLACAYVLTAAFQAEGWDMRATGYGEVEDLPVYRYRRHGEMEVKPCAEAWLTDRAAEVVMRKGLVPLLSIKGRNAIRLAGLQSLRGKLAGRFGQTH